MAEITGTHFPVNPDYVSVERHVLQDNINLIDAKSGILMALAGGFIVRCLDKFFQVATAPHTTASPVAMLALVLYAMSAFGFFATAYFTWFVLKPRVVKTNDLVYWGSDIFLRGEKHFVTAVEATEPGEFRLNFLRHLYVLAGICRKKYLFFGRAMRAAEFSLLVTLGAEIARYGGMVSPLILGPLSSSTHAFARLVHF